MLRSELRALRNTFGTKEGQQALLGTAIVLLCLAAAGLSLGSMLTGPKWLELLRDPVGGALAASCGAMLLLPAVLVVVFARIPCRAQLFDGSHVPAWLASPAGTRRIVAMVWFRQVAFAFVSASAVAAVPVMAMAVRAQLPWSTVFGFLSMLVLVVGACIAVVILTMVAATRYGSAPRWRRFLLLLHLSMTLVAMVLMLSGFTRGESVMQWLADLSPSESAVGAFLVVAAALPAQLAAGDVALSAFYAPAVLVVVTVLALAAAARLYRSAFEARLCAAPTVSTQRSGAWPSSAVASLVRRGAVDAWRGRSNLALVALFGAGVVWRIASNPFEAYPGDPVGLVREVFFLQSGWLMIACILAMLLFLGVIGDEQKQLPLLATSPLARRDLLRSRVILLGWPLLLTVLLAALAGKMVGGVSWSGTLFYLAASLPFALVLLGSALAVGSWPAFIKAQSDVPLASNVRSVVPVLVLSVVSGVLLYVHHLMHMDLVERGAAQTEWVGTALLFLLAVWASAVCCYLLLCKVAHRNLTRLLGPQA